MKTRRVIKAQVPQEIWDADQSWWNALTGRHLVAAWIKSIREIINNNNTKMVEEINNNPDRTTPEDNKQDWNEIYDEYSREQWPPFGGPFTNATSLIDWLKQNYESPERLKQ